MFATLHTTYECNGRTITANQIISGDGEYSRDFQVEAGKTEVFRLAVEMDLTVSIVICAGEAMTIKLGKIDTDLAAGQALAWSEGCGLKCPLEADTKEITVANNSKQTGTLHVRIIERAKPKAPAVSVEVTHDEGQTWSPLAAVQQDQAISCEITLSDEAAASLASLVPEASPART